MMLALDQGALQNSQSPGRCRSGSVIKKHGTSEIQTLFHSHFSKVNDLGAMDQTAPARRGTRVGAIWGSAEGAALPRFGCERITLTWDTLSSLLTFPTC
jgi:hypothetical protein